MKLHVKRDGYRRFVKAKAELSSADIAILLVALDSFTRKYEEKNDTEHDLYREAKRIMEELQNGRK